MIEKYSKPLIPQRADPCILLAPDGWYYFTASVPAFDLIELRRARTIEELLAINDLFFIIQAKLPKHGFILRYPKGKEAETKIGYESWHFRFVGREAASDIFFGDLCLEEYLAEAQQSH